MRVGLQNTRRVLVFPTYESMRDEIDDIDIDQIDLMTRLINSLVEIHSEYIDGYKHGTINVVVPFRKARITRIWCPKKT